jgi:hypothetical protein
MTGRWMLTFLCAGFKVVRNMSADVSTGHTRFEERSKRPFAADLAEVDGLRRVALPRIDATRSLGLAAAKSHLIEGPDSQFFQKEMYVCGWSANVRCVGKFAWVAAVAKGAFGDIASIVMSAVFRAVGSGNEFAKDAIPATASYCSFSEVLSRNVAR